MLLKWGKKNKYKGNHTYMEVYVLNKEFQSKKQVRKVRKVYESPWNTYGTCVGMKDPLDFAKYEIPEVPAFIKSKLGTELLRHKKGMWLF